MSTSSRKSSGPVLPIASTFRRSISPSGRFCNSAMVMPDVSSFASSSSSSFTYSSNSSSGFFQNHRSSSPTRVSLHALSSSSPTPSVRFSINRSGSPGRSMAVSPQNQVVRKHNGRSISLQKRTCLCSPTTHPGSFRCALHKNNFGGGGGGGGNHSISYTPNRLNARRSAMTNSLVRIGTVEGDLVKRALSALIRPSSHQQRRRFDFQPRPSRLSIMSKAEDH
ncbi:serine-rich protein-related [Forsythia ovata]|uniref:Serine-rich protein-related n=1 Tax=Forsythia ovata TaxID=205694 RepID=A0ABD1WIJ0_9LAMI